MAEVRVALVGLGRFGRLHAETLRSLPGCAIAAVCDADPALVERCGEQWGVAGRYRELGTLLADADIDAVDIVTGEAAHGEQARLAQEVTRPSRSQSSTSRRRLTPGSLRTPRASRP